MSNFIRYSSAFVGLTLICVALFMYEAEHKRLQSFLEALWSKIDDVAEVALSKHTNLLRGVAHIMSTGLIRLLGERAFSLRMLAISVCFSVASFGLSLIVLGALPPSDLMLISLGAVVLNIAAVYGLAPILIRSKRVFRLWAAPLIIVGLALLFWLIHDLDLDNVFGRSWYLIWTAFGIGLCVAFLAITKRILGRLCHATSCARIIAILVLNFVPFLLLVGLLYVRTSIKSNLFMNGLLSYGFATNAIPAFTSLVFFALAITLIANRVIWPTISRPLYAIQDIGIARRKKLLCVAGAALVGLSGLTGSETVIKATEQIVKLLP